MNLIGGMLRLDSWANALTGLGDALRDKLNYTFFYRSPRLNDTQLDELYHGDDMASRIVDELPGDALRRWFTVGMEDDDEMELDSIIQEDLQRLDAATAIEDAAKWARCFGGAVVYMGVEDGQVESEPVNIDQIAGISFLVALDKRFIRVQDYSDEISRFGLPETYRIAAAVDKSTGKEKVLGTPIHHSRILRFGGAPTTIYRRQRNGGWDDSVLQRVHDVLRNFNVAWQSVAHIMQDWAQGVFKIKDLIDMIASGDKETLQRRMEAVELGRSVARAIVIDSEGEDFERQQINFAHIPEVLRAFAERLGAAVRYPLTKLLGTSPGGMNATGESDLSLWYDNVEAYQQKVLLKPITTICEYLAAARNKEADKITVNFNRLWQMSDKDQAEVELAVAKKDEIYWRINALLAEEIALSRFKPKGFSMHTQIDLDARRGLLATAQQKLVDELMQVPSEDDDVPEVEKDDVPEDSATDQS